MPFSINNKTIQNETIVITFLTCQFPAVKQEANEGYVANAALMTLILWMHSQINVLNVIIISILLANIMF